MTNILIVDDDEVYLEGMKELLEEARTEALRELDRLSRMSPAAAEYTVAQLAEALGTRAPETGTRRVQHETSSLEAYRAFTEGRVRLEALDASLVPQAIADFERAVALDPQYAAAHVGLANARFWEYELSRARNQPDAALLARAIDHVRRAIELDRDLAEAHATLAFLLVSAGRAAEALAEARRAVSIEPGYWGNQFRLAHAAWGEERLQTLARAVELYPDFPFAHFEAAMVHIARNALDRAGAALHWARSPMHARGCAHRARWHFCPDGARCQQHIKAFPAASCISISGVPDHHVAFHELGDTCVQ